VRRIKHPFDVAVLRPHDADPRQQGRAAVAFGDQDQDFNGRLPFLDLLFCLRQLLDISGGILEGDELATQQSAQPSCCQEDRTDTPAMAD
jgi:hypothetical protein